MLEGTVAESGWRSSWLPSIYLQSRMMGPPNASGKHRGTGQKVHIGVSLEAPTRDITREDTHGGMWFSKTFCGIRGYMVADGLMTTVPKLKMATACLSCKKARASREQSARSS